MSRVVSAQRSTSERVGGVDRCSRLIGFGNNLATLELAATAAIRNSGRGNPFLYFIVFFCNVLDQIFFFIFVGTTGCNSCHG